MPFTSADLGAEQFSAYVLEHISQASVLLNSGARRVNVTGRSAHVPRVLSDGSASWVDEGEEIPSNAPDADEMLLTPRALKNTVSVSTEAIEDAAFDAQTTIGDAMVRAVARSLDVKAFSADAAAATSPAGLLNLLSGVGSVGTVDVATIRARIAALRGVGALPSAVYVHADDYAALDAENDSTGRGLLQPDPTLAGAQMVGGARLYIAPFAAAGTAIIAEAQQIVCGVRRDARVEFSGHAGWTSDSVVARVVARVDYDINDPAGIDLITVA